MTTLRLVSVFVLAGALGCGAEAPAPDKPTWVDDVLPLMKANCFSCHGPTANPKNGNYRWDVYDLSAPPYAELDLPYADLGFIERVDQTTKAHLAWVGVNESLHYPTVTLWVGEMNEAARMPPIPATRLSARDVRVLENFRSDRAPGEHKPKNHTPTIAWLDQKAGRYLVTDADGDQVLGKLDCAGTAVIVKSTGSALLPKGVTGPCTANLYDGWGDTLTTGELK